MTKTWVRSDDLTSVPLPSIPTLTGQPAVRRDAATRSIVRGPITEAVPRTLVERLPPGIRYR